MAPAETMGIASRPTIQLGGHAVECRLVPSCTARKLRIKVKPGGIELIVPEGRTAEQALAFLTANEAWATAQLERAQALAFLRRPTKRAQGQVLFQGEFVRVQVIRSEGWRAPNKVALEHGSISVTCAPGSLTPPVRSLENWLRKQARDRIAHHMAAVVKRIKRSPGRVYVMGQRTKWGNCSALGNLSFNWRLIMAPDHVLHYIVAHEMVHLAVPDHSPKFWLTVQSICPTTERSRQWLVANGQRLTVPLKDWLYEPGASLCA
jgi:predicted metal-dependent hydrolase